MNFQKPADWTGSDPSRPRQPVLIEVVDESDVRDDLTAAADLCAGMHGEFDTHLLCLTESPQDERLGGGAIRLWRSDPKLPYKLRFVLNSIRPDIVHTHKQGALAVVGHAARQTGSAQIVHSVGAEVTGAQDWQFVQFMAIAGGLSALLVVPSEEVAGRMPADARVEVLRAGIDCGRYVPGNQANARRKTGLPSEPRIVGCATPVERLEPLFHTLFRMNTDIHLALFGQATLDHSSRALTRRLGLSERIHFVGPWAKPELIFQAIDAYVGGPSDDHMPRAVLAAQACGKPAIACMPAPSEMLCPQTGRLVPFEYMPTLLNGLQRALQSADPEPTRRFIIDNWRVERMLDGYADLFHQLAADVEPRLHLA